MLTIEQVKKYVSRDGSQCPYCGSLNISAEPMNDCYVPVHCNNCDEDWKDIYQLIGVDNILLDSFV